VIRLLLFFINALTLSRLILAFSPFWITSSFEFLCASVWAGMSDYFDGLLARRYHLTTSFGSQLDQIADKAFHLSMVFYLWHTGVCHLIFAIAFSVREVLIVILRYLDKLRKTSNSHGKVKTALTYVLIICAFTWTSFFEVADGPFVTTVIIFEVTIILVSYQSLFLGRKN
jgi:CDP-diacylglycerol---glycerol-3-phosphate 3-phosphatidyltransferase